MRRLVPATWPVFTRVFVVMVAGVLSVQLVNALLFLAFRPPPPTVVTIGQVAAALRSGRSETTQIRIGRDAPTRAADPGDPRGRRLATALAAAMAVPVEQVRVRFDEPQLFDPFRPLMRGGGPPRRHPDDLLIGDFRAWKRSGDGWVSARPANGFAAWRLRGLLGLIVGLIAVVPFAILLARWVARPISVFAAAAERLGRNPRAAPLPVDGPPEIAEAAAAFNEMQHRLARYVDDRTMMLASIAHDLRTPLMRVGLALEALPASAREGCERNLAEMQAMLAAATAYVRDVTQVGERRRFDLRSVAESVIDARSDLGDPVEIAPGESIVIEGDRLRLKAAVENLVDNAVRYAGSARVTLARRGNEAVLTVRDHGPGIEPDLLTRVFEPFFRIETSRSRETGGSGLGLASVRGVARAHGGDVTLRNAEGGGIVAELVLPL